MQASSKERCESLSRIERAPEGLVVTRPRLPEPETTDKGAGSLVDVTAEADASGVRGHEEALALANRSVR